LEQRLYGRLSDHRSWLQPIARELGLATLGTLHERFGDSLEGTCAIAVFGSSTTTPAGTVTETGAVPTEGYKPAMWARVIGQNIDNRLSGLCRSAGHRPDTGLPGPLRSMARQPVPGHTDSVGVYSPMAAQTST
jgi:hypothetical protein